MNQIDAGSPPDFAAMTDRQFSDAMMEFLDLCDQSHPHWRLWGEEQTRRAIADREARKLTPRHLTAAYVMLKRQAA